MKKPIKAVIATLWLATGAAGAADQAGCTIAGYDMPPNVCASHTRTIASTCFICHGPNGKSQAAIPPLAGRDKAELLAALQDFRDGKREATVMQKYVKGYSDSEYEDLADYFSAIK